MIMMTMMRHILTVVAAAALAGTGLQGADPLVLEPGKMTRTGTVNPRFQSYNVEMVEVTGGRFWAPYKSQSLPKPTPPAGGALSAPGLDPSLFRTREPIDLANPVLRKLAAALGPAFIRVSGTWANSTYFHDSDAPAPTAPPAGFGGVLTRAQWRGVIDFSKAVNAEIVTSFAISAGTRDDAGVWSSGEAGRVLAFTRQAGGHIAAAEFFNEPSIASMGGAPAGYTAASYGRDFKVFQAFAKKAAPEMKILGPGSVGEGGLLGGGSGLSILPTQDLLTAAGKGVEAFSYHFYGAVSKRCAGMGSPQASAEKALSEEWLGRTDRDAAFYEGQRDRFEPGKEIWLTETGETACGGNPWASSFLDSFRYLDQMGRLARRGVQVIAHNTLAASDYGLIDEETLTPRPNYWSALLWHRLMGATVLDSGVKNGHVYAHCLAGHPGGVAVLAINPDSNALTLRLPAGGGRYSLSSPSPEQPVVDLNGHRLSTGSGGVLPELKPVAVSGGNFPVAPGNIVFLEFPKAGNPDCR